MLSSSNREWNATLNDLMNRSRPGSGLARVGSIDIAKGIAILLMVFGHTEQGAMHRHWWDNQPRLIHGISFANAFIYSYHMPTFFFISGLFVAQSLQRRGFAGFSLEKIRALLYPYVLWGLLTGLSEPFTERFRSAVTPFSWHRLFESLLTGGASWFLVTLFTCEMLGILFFKLPHWAQMTLAMTGSWLIPYSDANILYDPFVFLPFLIAGIWVGSERLRALEQMQVPYAWASFSCLLLLQITLISRFGQTNRWNKIPIGLVGIFMVLFLSRAFRDIMAGALLRWFGAASLSIFLISPFAQGAGRELVLRLGHTMAPAPQLIVPVVLAATLPALIWQFRERMHIGWLFRPPSFNRAASVKGAADPRQSRVERSMT
jgi:fucose 4-O-acetylase-like acetyltransferase